MIELEKTVPDAAEYLFRSNSEKAIEDMAMSALQNHTTYKNVFDRNINGKDAFRVSALSWHLYFGLKELGYKMRDNEKLPIDAFDVCIGHIDDLLL
jgi:hypothetical protein